MKERKLELIKYLETLMHLKECGIKCDDKIEVALNELHSEMKFPNGNIYNITINSPSKEDVSNTVKKIMKDFENQAKKSIDNNGLTHWYSDRASTITSSTSSTIVGKKVDLTGNPFDIID